MIPNYEEQRSKTHSRGLASEDQEATERRHANDGTHSKKQHVTKEDSFPEGNETKKMSGGYVDRVKEHIKRKTEKGSKRTRGYDGL